MLSKRQAVVNNHQLLAQEDPERVETGLSLLPDGSNFGLTMPPQQPAFPGANSPTKGVKFGSEANPFLAA